MSVRLAHLAAPLVLAALSACGGSDTADTPSADGEPNDTVAQAMSLTAGVLASSTLGTEADVDYFRFDVPEGGAIAHVETLDADGVGCDALDTLLDLVRDDGTATGAVLATDDDSGTYFCSDLIRWLDGGTYYVAVRFGSVAVPGLGYSVGVTLVLPSVADRAEVEPNDTAATATLASPYVSDALLEASISSPTDVDYFRVNNTTSTSKTVYVEAFEHTVGYCPSADTTFDLYDAGTGTWIGSNDDSGVNLCSRAVLTLPGNTGAVVKVASKGATFTYLLEIDFLY